MSTQMRPIRETIPLEEARELIDGAIRPIARTVRVALIEANGRVVAEPVTSTRDVPPFARAGMDGYAVVAEDTFGASRYEPKTLRVVEKIYTGQMPTQDCGRRRSRGDCDRRADAGGRRRGRDGRGDRARGHRRRENSDACVPAPERRTTGRRHRHRPGRAAAWRRAQSEPDRCAGGARPGRGRRLRPAARRDSFDRQRDRRSGRRAAARADLRHQSLYAQHGHCGSRRRGAAVPDRAGHD